MKHTSQSHTADCSWPFSWYIQKSKQQILQIMFLTHMWPESKLKVISFGTNLLLTLSKGTFLVITSYKSTSDPKQGYNHRHKDQSIKSNFVLVWAISEREKGKKTTTTKNSTHTYTELTNYFTGLLCLFLPILSGIFPLLFPLVPVPGPRQNFGDDLHSFSGTRFFTGWNILFQVCIT